MADLESHYTEVVEEIVAGRVTPFLGAGINLGLIAWVFGNYGPTRGFTWLAILLTVVISIAYAIENPLFPDGLARHRNPPLLVKHVGNTAAAGEVTVVPGKDAADLRRRPVFVVGRGFDDHRHATGRVTFIDDFIEMLRFHSLTRAAFDGALDVVVRHALGTGGKDCAAEPRVAIGIAPARFRRDGDFAGKLAEERTSFRVDRALEPLNLGPLAVSRHEMGILNCRTDLCSFGNRRASKRIVIEEAN